MSGCNFLGNSASDTGSALYTTVGVKVSLEKFTFQYSVTSDNPVQEFILFVSGKIVECQGLFQISILKPESYVGDIKVFFIGQSTNLNIQTNCPKWYNHEIEYSSASTNSQAIRDAHYKCSPCMDNYYTTSVEKSTLRDNVYMGVRTPTKTDKNETSNCLQCPYGAICSGNNVIPRPNFWGYWYNGELVFHQCPAGYCCSGKNIDTCDVYDHCPGNRTGILCGACQNGFSVSILTGTCIPDNLCGKDQWFWPLVILVTMAYAFWYTLKNDLFNLCFISYRSIKHVYTRSKSNAKKHPVKDALNEMFIS